MKTDIPAIVTRPPLDSLMYRVYTDQSTHKIRLKCIEKEAVLPAQHHQLAVIGRRFNSKVGPAAWRVGSAVESQQPSLASISSVRGGPSSSLPPSTLGFWLAWSFGGLVLTVTASVNHLQPCRVWQTLTAYILPSGSHCLLPTWEVLHHTPQRTCLLKVPPRRKSTLSWICFPWGVWVCRGPPCSPGCS